MRQGRPGKMGPKEKWDLRKNGTYGKMGATDKWDL